MGWGRAISAVACVGLAFAFTGCTENELAPPAPDSEGGVPDDPPISSPRDAGDDDMDGAIPDGGRLPDGGLPLGCIEVTDEDDANGVAVDSVASADAGTAPPFEPTRAYFKWNPDDCDTPPDERRLLAALTEGQCFTGLGRRLVFSLQGDQVGTGITPGPQPVAFSSFIGVLFVVPRPGEEPNLVWANTADSSGNVTIDDVGDTPGEPFRATFDFTLPTDDETSSRPALRFTGSIDVTLDQPFDEVCRGRPDGGT